MERRSDSATRADVACVQKWVSAGAMNSIEAIRFLTHLRASPEMIQRVVGDAALEVICA